MVAYLDHNAGAPTRPEVVAAMVEALAEVGNPSSVHAFGRRARARMESARNAIAALVGADGANVTFTSGGTEANNLVLRGTGRRLLVSAVEHASIRDAAPGAAILPVDASGVVDPAALEALLAADERPALVSVMLANNETGVVQPVAELARIAHAHGALFHCDGAQGPGRMSVRLSELNVDFLTLSAHKLGGPAGVGVLIGSKTDEALAPILLGGGQERRVRAGTENLAGIVGFGVAARLAAGETEAGDVILGMRNLRDRLEAEISARLPSAVVVGAGAARLCNTSCLALSGIPAQLQVMALDLAGVMVSAGAACSSGKVAQSHVLTAMGLGPDLAGCALRVSLGPASRWDEVECFLAAWCDVARRKGLDVRDAAQAA